MLYFRKSIVKTIKSTKILKYSLKVFTIDKKYYKILLTRLFGGEIMEQKRKEELLKANLAIFEELDDSDKNYILGYVSGLAMAKKIKKS